MLLTHDPALTLLRDRTVTAWSPEGGGLPIDMRSRSHSTPDNVTGEAARRTFGSSDRGRRCLVEFD